MIRCGEKMFVTFFSSVFGKKPWSLDIIHARSHNASIICGRDQGSCAMSQVKPLPSDI